MGGAGYAAIVREIFDRVWNRGDFDGLDSRLVERVVFHYRRSTRTLEPDDLAALVTAWREAFPDLRFSIEDLVEDGDRVAARLTHSGTHRGRFRGVEPTGRRIEVDAMFFFRFEGGRLAEVWEVEDEHAMWQQLGTAHPG